MLALAIIVVAGIYYACAGHVENFNRPIEGTNWDPGHIALAFYSGLFSYSGYNYLNFVTEELKDPYKLVVLLLKSTVDIFLDVKNFLNKKLLCYYRITGTALFVL